MKKMNVREWEALRKVDPAGYFREYRDLMFSIENSHDCEKCPENREMEDGGRLPCGQFHCWVDVSNEEEE